MRLYLAIVFFLVTIHAWSLGFNLFEENGKVGMKNDQGKVVLPPTFEALGWSDGSFSVRGETTGYKLNGRWGLINLKQERITQAEFELLVSSGANRVIARKPISAISIKSGCLTLTGKVAIPFIYDAISIYGLRAVVMEKRGAHYFFGLTDLDNKTILPVQYSNIYPVGSLRFAVENSAGKLALYSDAGKPITEFFIDSIGRFYREHAILFSNGLQGLINRDGDVAVPPQYRKIEQGEIIRGLQPSQWKIISPENIELQSLVADEVHPYSNKYFRIVRAGKQGLIDRDLKTIWPLIYDAIELANDGRAIVKKNGHWGLLDSEAREILPFEFDSIVWDAALVRALSNSTGKPMWSIINVESGARSRNYDRIRTLDKHHFKVTKGGYQGLLNSAGVERLHCVYDSILEIRGDQVAVKFKGQYGIVSMNETWLLAPQPNRVWLVNNDRYLEQQPGNIFLKSFTGNIIYFTPNPVDVYSEFLLERLPDQIMKKIDWDGVEIKSMSIARVRSIDEYEEKATANPFVNGLQLFEGQGKFGFRDNRGRLVIPNRYDSAKSFSDNAAAFKLLGKWGYLNTDDKIIVNPAYDFADDFVNGFAIVSAKKKFGLINKSGTLRLSLQYDSIIRYEQKLLVYQNDRVGLATEDGRILVQPRYDMLEVLPNNQLRVKLNSNYGAISADGLNVIPILYDSLEYDHQKNVYLAHQAAKWITLSGF